MTQAPERRAIALTLRDVVGMTEVGPVGKPVPLNLTVARGEIGVVLGGKEVAALFRIILGIGTLSQGEIVLADGRAFRPGMSDFDLSDYRAGLGYSFRDKGLMSNISLIDNVDLPARYHVRYNGGAARGQIGARALEELGVSKTLWDRRPATVTQDARKRAMLARAIALDPAVVLLDDPPVLVPTPDYPWLLNWIANQRTKGRAQLLGTNDWPFGLALADWVLHPKTNQPTVEWQDLVEPTWLSAAALLKERILAA